MTRHKLEASADHVEGLASEKQPVRAIAELIWNSLDADATEVRVVLERNAADGIERVAVVDNGHGISPEEAVSAFTRIGGSWKKHASGTKDLGRPLHGNSGQGRLRAFALGSQIRWTSTALDATKAPHTIEITSAQGHRDEFDISGPRPTTAATGTEFVGSGGQSQYIERLTAPNALSDLTATFAPYLVQHHDVQITYDDRLIDPEANIRSRRDFKVPVDLGSDQIVADLLLLEWEQGSTRSIHLCEEPGVSLVEIPTKIASDFTYSAYLRWDGASDGRNDYLLEGTPPAAVLNACKEKLRDHFDLVRRERQAEAIATWRNNGTYPYPETPENEAAALEEAGYAAIATALSRHVPSQKSSQKLVLGLLKKSMQHSPDSLGDLLEKLLGLPADDVTRMNDLLRHTSLSNVIKAATTVTDRLAFLQALEFMVFETEAKDLVNERDHLHRIIERELWIFGEEFNAMTSETGLTAVLQRHRELMNDPLPRPEPVTTSSGKVGRVDLFLSAAAREHDRRRHLVVELKRPSVDAGYDQLKQIKQYANAVHSDDQFGSLPVVWDFWLITSGIEGEIIGDVRQKDKPNGLAYEPDISDRPVIVRAWVRTWAEIIEEARSRLQFMHDELNVSPTLADARHYLRTHHSDVLPAALAEDSDAAAV